MKRRRQVAGSEHRVEAALQAALPSRVGGDPFPVPMHYLVSVTRTDDR